jgi:glycosyltransferase involved in cell wall biosynthesis
MTSIKIGILAPIAWRTPPSHYGPWEQVASLICESLVEKGFDVTLFATANSITRGTLEAVVQNGYEEFPGSNAKVNECLHISHCFEMAHQFDLIHNHFDFLPLTYSSFVKTPLITTIHGFSSPSIIPVYKKYNRTVHYVSISDADRSPDLDYIDTVYHGINLKYFSFNPEPENYLLYFGRIHPDKGTAEAIDIARKSKHNLLIAGIIQDDHYFKTYIEPQIDNKGIVYIKSVGPVTRNLLLQNALALLHPIHFDEPFGLSIIEAMACGTPVIAFNRGSMSEIITSGYNGFLVSSVDEAIEKVRAIKSIKRSNCRITVKKRFSSEIMVNNYIEVYKKVLGF